MYIAPVTSVSNICTSELDVLDGQLVEYKAIALRVWASIKLALYLVLNKFNMKSLILIREINYNILNYILNFIYMFNLAILMLVV